MASRGLTILLLGAACYVLGVATQIGWLYLFAALILSMGAVSAFAAWLGLRNIELSRVLLGSKKARPVANVTDISEGDELEIGIVVRNNSRLPKYLLKVIESCPLEEPGKQARSFFLVSLGSRESVTITYSAKCYRRGEFDFAHIVVEAASPFGILTRRREFRSPLPTLVYPDCYPLRHLPPANHAYSNSGSLVKARAGGLFCGSREYQPGDSLRHVHWHNTARWGMLMVKEFEATARSGLAITFDASSNLGQGKESTVEYAIKIAASAVAFCASQGVPIHLLPGQGFSRLSGTYFRETMTFLAKLQVGAETNLNELLALSRLPFPVLAIASLASAQQLDMLRELSAKTRDLTVVALTGFAEQEFPQTALSSLRTRGANIILCRRGDLEAALREMESVDRRTTLPLPVREVQEAHAG